jgi:ABC-type transport system involved in multi-copper enzyme maturation permease subunit
VRAIRIIAINTFREIIRDRILYGIIVFALLLVSLSIALGALSFAEQARISANFGFTGIQLSAAIVSIFVGSTLVAREIEKQTILTLLARPISRSQFLLGKFLGLIMVILVVMSGLAVVLAGVVASLDLAIRAPFFVALYGVFLESILLIAITLFFGVVSRPIMSVIFTSAVFLIGHWVGSLDGLVKKNATETFRTVVKILNWCLPDFERFNWRAAPIYDSAIAVNEIVFASIYAYGWVIFLMTLTIVLFRRRDFV